MWKAAFTGRSDSSSVAGGSNSGRRKKRSSSSTGARADSIASAPVLSRREPDEEDARRTSTTRHHRSNRSAYSGDEVRNDGGRGSSSMAYVTAPGLSSRAGGGPGALTESAIRALDAGDEDEWEDEVGDVRSERRSKRGIVGMGKGRGGVRVGRSGVAVGVEVGTGRIGRGAIQRRGARVQAMVTPTLSRTPTEVRRRKRMFGASLPEQTQRQLRTVAPGRYRRWAASTSSHSTLAHWSDQWSP